MRPVRFVAFLAELIDADGQATGAWSFADVGYQVCPYGLVLLLPTQASVYLQVVARPHPLEQPADAPEQVVHGPPPSPVRARALPTAGLTNLVDVERYLAALLTGSGCRELAEVGLFADRPRPGAVPYGLALRFHNGWRLWVYVRHCLPAGRRLSERERPFRRLERV